MPEPILDRPGEWEIAVTIRRNGRRAAFVDAMAVTYDGAVYAAMCELESRRVTYTGRHAKEATDA